ncbi:MAG: TolC family protein, partial [Alphaproteobacteria bacterium]|nr:TolC family protein [Alphaproteobacteria bacterium]
MSNQQTLKRILSGISLSAVLLSGVACAETLEEALTYTYVANPEILAQRAYLRSVQEKITQSQSGYKPTVAGQASYGYEYERTRTAPIFQENESRPVTFGISAVQPIFSGFATSASVKAAKALFEAEKSNLKTAEQTALINAVVAYTDVIRALAVLKLNQNNETVLQRQLEYTQDRFRVGELTKTDVAQAEARHAGAVAAKISAEGDVKIAYAAYRKVIGKMPDKIYEPEVPAAKLPQTLEDALEIALKNNPAVLAAEKQAQSAQSSIEAVEAGYYPSLELQATYQNMRAGAHGTANIAGVNVRTGRTRDEDSTVKLVLDVPFYTAGSTSSKVR